MKQISMSTITRKVIILAFLIVGFVFVLSDNTQNVQAAPPCSSCPGSSPADVYFVCASECGATSGSCFDDCVFWGDNCWRSCV